MCAIQPSRDSKTHNCFTWITDELLHRWRSGFKLDVMVVIHQSQCGDPLNLTLYFSLNGDNNAQNLHHRLIVCVCLLRPHNHVRCCSNEAGTTGYKIRISTAVPDLKKILLFYFLGGKKGFVRFSFLTKLNSFFIHTHSRSLRLWIIYCSSDVASGSTPTSPPRPPAPIVP